MYKENGREKPADPKETAKSMGKTFECPKCGHTEVRRDIEFGSTPWCRKCDEGVLVEKLDV